MTTSKDRYLVLLQFENIVVLLLLLFSLVLTIVFVYSFCSLCVQRESFSSFLELFIHLCQFLSGPQVAL